MYARGGKLINAAKPATKAWGMLIAIFGLHGGRGENGGEERERSNFAEGLLAMWEILANFAHDNRALARLPDKQASIPYFYATDSPSRPDA